MKAKKASSNGGSSIDTRRPDAVEPSVRVLKSAQCRSLSGRSTLGYEVGAARDGEIHVRIRSNSGSGCFAREWVPLRALQRELAAAPGPVTSGTLRRAFAGKSANSSGFLAAALLGEGLLEPLANARGYAPTDGVGFMSEVRRLLDGGPSPQAADGAPKKADVAEAAKQKADVPLPSKAKAPAPAKAKKTKR